MMEEKIVEIQEGDYKDRVSGDIIKVRKTSCLPRGVLVEDGFVYIMIGNRVYILEVPESNYIPLN